MFEILREKGFEILVLHHAEAILRHDMVFAESHGIESIEDLQNYDYRPTDRQRDLIAHAAEQHGFAEGWARKFVADKFGEATTHWRKLEDRVRRGVGNPCPLLLIGLPLEMVIF